jgi:FkbM family methyltransferase
MYELEEQTFRTPRGSQVRLLVRGNSNDWNVVTSCLTEDEYGLAPLHLTGRALDVGAHIGGVTIALAIDNPELEVTAIEAVPSNVELLRRNLALNGLTERVVVVDGAACGPRQQTQKVAYGYRGSELATHHAFIGNATIVAKSAQHDVVDAPCHALSEFTPLDFMKIDAEGAEWAFLQGPALADVAFITGEWHPTAGHIQIDVVGLLSATHGVTFTGPREGPGGFVAVRS